MIYSFRKIRLHKLYFREKREVNDLASNYM